MSSPDVRPVGRRDFMKVGAGAGALALLHGCGGGGREEAASGQGAPAAASPAAAKDAADVVWEMRQSERPPISVDVHAHWAPETYVSALAGAGRAGGNPVPLMDDLKTKIRWMDERAVRTLVLTLNGGMPWQWLSPAESARLAAVVNDAGIEAHAAFPERFVLGAEIPAWDPDLALKELNRIAGNPAVRGVHLPPSVEAKDYLFEPAFGPVLARCEQLGYSLLFHPLDNEVNIYGGTQTRLASPIGDDTFISNTLGFPMDTATTAAKLIVTGTLDKYPKLEVVLPHAGGSFPYVAGRIEHSLVRRKFPLQRPFREYIRRFHYDTMTYYPETLRFLIEFAGADRVVVGTDSNYNRSALDRSGPGRQGRYEWPNALIEHLKLPQEDEERILRGNAARLFRL